MSKCVAFLHRNSFHKRVFVEVGKVLREKYNVEIRHLRELGDIKGEKVFQFEKWIEKKWNDIDISYSNLHNLEKEYKDSNLMRALYSEREYNFFPRYYRRRPVSYEEQLRYLVGFCVVLEEWLEENHVDCVISDLPTGLPDVLQAICGRRDVPYISVRSSKLLPGFIMCDQYFDMPIGMSDVYNSFLDGGVPDDYRMLAQSHINELRERIKMPSYMEITGKPFKLLRMEKLRSAFSALLEDRHEVNKISRAKYQFRNAVLWNLHRFLNILLTRVNRSRWFVEELPREEKYFLFPLQYEPEASTYVRAFPFFDQMCVIQQISKALPMGITLVVKEHRGNQGYRKAGFYRELQYLPNVRLVPREMELSELIRNSIGVITLTSRMGWEALVFRKPVIAFGSTFWTSFEEVKKPGSWIELKRMIEESVDGMGHNTAPDYDKKLVAYAAAYISLTHKGNYVPGSEEALSESNIQNIVESIILGIRDSQFGHGKSS